MARNGNNGTSSAINAVILDFGEVLCYVPDPEIMGRMARVFGIPPDNFLARYQSTRGPYDQGLLTPEEYWVKFGREAGVSVDAELLERLRAMDVAMWSRINREMTEWAKALHGSGLTTALLSNMPHDMAAHARKNFDWMRHFNHELLSCEMRLIKPDVAIFEHSVERIGVPAEETLFVDDREENIAAARRVGLRAIRFRGVEDLRGQLEKIGFATVPGQGAIGTCEAQSGISTR
jgi:putative hydrolase of the HAD superfamily